MKGKRRAPYQYLIPLALLGAAAVLRAAEPALVEDIQLKVFDTFQRLKARSYEELPVRIVDLDDETLSRMGQWPWPRTQVALLIDRLRDLEAASIVFDAVFAEPDRTSPARILPLWPSTPELDALRAKVEALPDHDRILSESIAQGRVTVGVGLVEEANDREPVLKAGFAFSGEDPKQYLVSYKGAVVNLPQIERAAAGNGCFSILAERDGILRRVPILFRLRDVLFPSLGGEALRVAQGASAYAVRSSGASGEANWGGSTGISQVKIGDWIVPTDGRGQVWLYDTGYVSRRMVPAWKLFESGFPQDALSGFIVFIGSSATGLRDIRATPLNPVASGVEVHAQIVEQILSGSFLKRPDWATGAEMSFLVLTGLFLVFLLPGLGAFWCALAGLGALGGVFFLSWHLFSTFQWLLDPVYPSLACLAIYLASSLIHYVRTESERREIRDAFSRYLSPQVVKRLVENPGLLKLGGEKRNMTVLFADIRGFTTLSEQFDAEGLTRFINRFLTPMTDLILARGGTIDKFMGDCVMAFWNAPLDDPDHARHACEAALDMRDYLVGWNGELKQESEKAGRNFMPVRVGIGINTGDCCVGNMGSDQRFDYSVIGDEVNLASRLEGQSKNYGVDIVLGENTCVQAGDFAVLELDWIQVRGKTKSSHIFALLGNPSLKGTGSFRALCEHHQAMLKAYRSRDWQEARKCLEECRRLDTGETRLRVLYDLYEGRM